MSAIQAKYLDHMGTDLSVINAARISFSQDDYGNLQPEPRTEAQILGLLNFLARGMQTGDWENTLCNLSEGVENPEELLKRIRHTPVHWAPFAHTCISVKCSAPVPIRTQAFKHKIGMVENEESRRYISSVPEIYIPDTLRSIPQGSIKQGSHGKHHASGYWLKKYTEQINSAVDLYTRMINDGICPEQARLVLPQGAIVNWVWTGNLYSFANFYLLRSDSHAQHEVQILAESIDSIVRPLFPKAWSALVDQ